MISLDNTINAIREQLESLGLDCSKYTDVGIISGLKKFSEYIIGEDMEINEKLINEEIKEQLAV